MRARLRCNLCRVYEVLEYGRHYFSANTCLTVAKQFKLEIDAFLYTGDLATIKRTPLFFFIFFFLFALRQLQVIPQIFYSTSQLIHDANAIDIYMYTLA